MPIPSRRPEVFIVFHEADQPWVEDLIPFLEAHPAGEGQGEGASARSKPPLATLSPRGGRLWPPASGDLHLAEGGDGFPRDEPLPPPLRADGSAAAAGIQRSFCLACIPWNMWQAKGIRSELDRWTRFFLEGQDLDPEALSDWMKTPEIEPAMETLIGFREKEENRLLYESRLAYTREQRTREADHRRTLEALEVVRQRLERMGSRKCRKLQRS